jgi:hypothetical protein
VTDPEPNLWEAPRAPVHPGADDRPRNTAGWLLFGYLAALFASTTLAMSFPLMTAAMVPLMVVLGVFFAVAVVVIGGALVFLVLTVLRPVVRLFRQACGRAGPEPR